MRKNEVNAILVNQTKRRNTVLALVCIIVVIFSIAFSFFCMYFQKDENQYVSYNETSDINYKVYLKENSFFDNNYLESDKQYIASLIEYIDSNFKYKLSLEEKDVEYKYSYRIEANVDVKETNSNNSLFNKSYELLPLKENISSSREVLINENIKIDYNYYNDLIHKFIMAYNLGDTESVLTINMYVNVIGACEDFEENQSKESVMSLSIPLTTKTVGVDLSNNLINNENLVMKCKTVNSNRNIFLALGIIFSLFGLGLVGITIKYEIETRTAETIYEKELKKILNNYGSYIQTLGSEFQFKGYQLLRVNSFNDMLEIRDTIRQPILLKENNQKNGAYFVIPSNTKILYVYRLKVSDFAKKIVKEKEGDIEEI